MNKKMNCPNCKNEKLSEKIKIGDVEINKCPSCEGLWFEKDELRLAKDKKLPDAKWLDIELEDKSLNWFHVDLWKDSVEFKAEKDTRLCPECEIPLYKIEYGDSGVEVDVCGICKGLWLDRGEYKKIINYVKKTADYEVLNNYAKNLASETKEIFIGPESMGSEIVDLIILTKLFKYKLAVQYPNIAKILLDVPK